MAAPAITPLSVRRAQYIARAASLVVIVTGLAVLVGWLFGFAPLMTVLPGLVAMKPNTAAGIAMSGWSLFLFNRRRAVGSDPSSGAKADRLGAALAATVTIIGAVTLLEYSFGLHLGIDQLLFPDPVASGAPGRMAPISAFNFVAVGLALTALRLPGRTSWAHALAGVVAFTSLLAILGYVYGVPALYQAGRSTAVALHTAVAFLLLCAAIWCATCDHGFMRVVIGTGTSGILVRRYGPASILLPFLIGWLRIQGVRHGWYDVQMGVVLVAMTNSIAFTALMWVGASSLRAAEERQAQVQESLREAHLDMEARVLQRTSELAAANADLQEQMAERAKAEHANQQIMQHSLDVICTFDAEGRFLQVSRACEKLLGCRPEDLIGRRFLDMVHPDDLPKSVAAAASIMSGAPVREFENRYRRADGSTVPIVWSAQWSQEQQIMFCVARDMTERKRVESELRAAKEAAEAASRAKSEFLANMSHEIRTPMNGILGMTELVLDTALDRQQREYLGMAKSSADTLLGLINDILDFSKIEAGKLELEAIDFSLRDCIGALLKPLGFRADQKGLELTADIPASVPDHVVGDPLRLRQVLINLTDNAIKFTRRGDVMLRVAVEAEGEGEHCLHFTVRDSGIGIPPAKQALIFEAFAQADGTTTRTYGGTGLGLAIASRLVEAMGGRIWVESIVGEGTAFHFNARFAAAPSPGPRARPTPPPRLEGLRVLVVDDNAVNRRILREILVGWKMQPTVVMSGAAALEEMLGAVRHGAPFPLVLLDGMMPEMDGFMVAERIRAHPTLARATVMMLSSAMPAGATARCAELGVASYLTKPVSQPELMEAILSALEPAAVAEAAAELARPASPLPANPGGLRILLVEDNAINRALATGILEKRGHRLQHAVNGREAVEAAAHETFDLILMDLQMPEMDGLEATRRIRDAEREAGRHTPIAAMTAHAMAGDRERCLAGGMDDYLSKPIQKPDLFALLERVSAGSSPADPPTGRIADGPPPPPIFDRARLLDQFDGDESLLQQVIALFRANTPGSLAAIRQMAGERNGPELARQAHALLSSLGVFGAMRAHELTVELERMGREEDLAGAIETVGKLENEVDAIYRQIEAMQPTV